MRATLSMTTGEHSRNTRNRRARRCTHPASAKHHCRGSRKKGRQEAHPRPQLCCTAARHARWARPRTRALGNRGQRGPPPHAHRRHCKPRARKHTAQTRVKKQCLILGVGKRGSRHSQHARGAQTHTQTGQSPPAQPRTAQSLLPPSHAPPALRTLTAQHKAHTCRATNPSLARLAVAGVAPLQTSACQAPHGTAPPFVRKQHPKQLKTTLPVCLPRLASMPRPRALTTPNRSAPRHPPIHPQTASPHPVEPAPAPLVRA